MAARTPLAVRLALACVSAGFTAAVGCVVLSSRAPQDTVALADNVDELEQMLEERRARPAPPEVRPISEARPTRDGYPPR